MGETLLFVQQLIGIHVFYGLLLALRTVFEKLIHLAFLEHAVGLRVLE